MKFTARAAIAALIAITATGPALVPLAGPALASSTPPAAARGLLGTWANTDPATRDVRDIVVTAKARGIMVDAFASCTPKSCEWGKIPGTVFGADVNSVTGHSLEANWDFRFVRDVFLATLTRPRGVPTLVVKEFKTFVDPGSRANYAKVETFVRAGHPIIPALSGKAGHGYPAGHWVKPVPSLRGTWKSTSPRDGIRKIVLSRNRNGSLRVHVFGRCGLSLCSLGTVQGITFGENIASVSGRKFLAPYTFGFKKNLLSGWANKAGTILTVESSSEFTDTSGRSNYVFTETFSRR